MAICLSCKDLNGGLCRHHRQCYRYEEVYCRALLDLADVTDRDIYYKDPALFKQQTVVNKYIDDFANTFGVLRSDLNVVGPSAYSP